MTFSADLFKKIKRFYFQKILKKRYYRHGSCNMCGACCENIYVRHNGHIIKDEAEFKEIQEKDSYIFYKHIDIISKDDFGLIFSCQKFDKEKKLCKDHKNRPPICRNYPSEEIFSFGAMLEEDCGYHFSPIESFEEVLKKVEKKASKKNKVCR